MDNSRLNINIYEYIIDELGPDRGTNSSYWCTTALVCSAWRRRSQYNLFRTVHLRTQSQVDLLFRTFRTNAPLADLVTSLTMGSLRGYYKHDPLTWLVPLLWEVKKCRALYLQGIDWRRYPALYASSVLREVQRCGSSTITTLEIMLSQSIFRPALLLIQALPFLKKLAVFCPTRLYTTSDTFPHDPKQAACNQLQNLQLWRCSEVSFPPMSFGTNVEELFIRIPEGGASDETLKCIRAFQRLQALHVECYIDNGQSAGARIKCLLSVLSIIGSSALQSLEIPLKYNTRYMSYLVLDRFPALRNFSFTLYDNSLQHERQWWEAELGKRLRSRLHSVITVSVRVIMSKGLRPFDGPLHARVWRMMQSKR
ncbi:hypothetical protein C8Q74DRAFT_500529 [Fomes fomentarius]|nr:hypothetical protein C8Q74DRAFT_500529 [Fomes fomentarius]